MGRSSMKVVECTAMRMLGLIVDRASGRPKQAVISIKDFSRSLTLSEFRIRFAQTYLEHLGYIRVIHRYGQDGGCLANGYRPTSTGRSALERYGSCEGGFDRT